MSDHSLLAERLRGRTFAELADRTGLTGEGARFVVAREARRQIDRIELDLLVATKTDEVVAFVVPDHGGENFDLALEYVRWVVAELTKREIKVAVHYRPTYNGVVVALEDVTRPRRKT
jgi:hypothetical protein